MQKLYVKINENDKPYLADVTVEQKDGYTAVYPMDSQVLALVRYTSKCFLKDDGTLVVPDQVPMSQAEMQLADLVKADANKDDLIKNLQSQVAKLTMAVAKGGNK
jgi:hypothetical protein